MRKQKPVVAARKRRVSILVTFFFLAFVVVNVVDVVSDHFLPASNAQEGQAMLAAKDGDEYILSGRVVRIADGDTLHCGWVIKIIQFVWPVLMRLKHRAKIVLVSLLRRLHDAS